jgi:hypothetical protein
VPGRNIRAWWHQCGTRRCGIPVTTGVSRAHPARLSDCARPSPWVRDGRA